MTTEPGSVEPSEPSPRGRIRRHAPWRRSLTREGVTPAQFAFQIVVVTVGVYVAILLQDQADRRSRKAAADRALAAVNLELAEDESNLRAVLEHQDRLYQALGRIATAVRTAEASDSILGELIGPQLPVNTTFFSRRAAYSALVSSGLLEFISNTKLRLQVAEIYARDYERLERNGALYDEIYQAVFWEPVLQYWDYEQGRRIETTEDAAIRVSNGAHRARAFSEHYRALLRTEMRSVAALRVSISRYLD